LIPQALHAAMYCGGPDVTLECSYQFKSNRGHHCHMISKASQPSLRASGNLKRAFENAVRDIYQVSLTGKASRYRQPIVQRVSRSIPESSLSAEKRALSDAAAALARLWKVAPNSAR
jgi:hypothetical protein